jgi:RHH-type proline utilization regulon transcriptional repressor/proline dehydrogenase/delta 1-pyrroline-5-carboxylate dehydrogenase
MSEPPADDLADLAYDAVAVARRWAAASDSTATRAERRASERLAHLVRDRAGVEFALHFIDRVIRPEDPAVAARELTRLVREREVPGFLGPVDRALLSGEALTAPRLPQVVVPLASRRVRQLVGHSFRTRTAVP